MLNRVPSGLYQILFALLIVQCLQCAKPVAPGGGPRDETPPAVVEGESTPNLQTNFSAREIHITFDEWIKLNDPANQIVISPPLEHRPDIQIRSKTLYYSFDDEEVLRPNTTYTINFGTAIQDITESNAKENFTFVFSTGTFIDSLELSGYVFDAETGEPASGVYVILHDNLSDTAITNLTPAYFATTGEQGNFTLKYLRSDTFAVFALNDVNANYRYDQPNEGVGFLLEPIVLSDTFTRELQLPVFVQVPPVVLLNVGQARGGPAKLAFSRALRDARLRPLDTRDTIISWLAEVDTLFVWHTFDDTVRLEVSEGEEIIDTARLYPPVMTDAPVDIALLTRSLHPDVPAQVRIPNPVAGLDTSKFSLTLQDTISVQSCVVFRDTTDVRIVNVDCAWQEKGRYALTAFAGAITDMYHRTNDTVRLSFSVAERLNFGQIAARIENLDSTMTYIVRLMQDNKLVEESIISGTSTHAPAYQRLRPGTYHITLIADRNGNGIWDPGNLDQKLLHERVVTRELGELRAGWDLDITILWESE